MTACDLGAITKPWDIQQKVAQKIADEFFYQGDLERDELHLLPSAQMDRANRAEFPTMQVSYIDHCCTPVYTHLAAFSDQLTPMLEGCQRNRDHWSGLIVKKEEEEEEVAGS